MPALSLNHTKQWLKQSQHPAAQPLFRILKAIRRFELPTPRLLAAPLYSGYCLLRDSGASLTRLFLWTPLVKGRLQHVGQGLYLYGGLPYIAGPVQIHIGNDCRLSGHSTITGRSSAKQAPQLRVGDNVDIGWMTTIAVGNRVVIGNNTRIAGRALLAGYPGHPLNAEARAAGLPELDEQVGDIVLEEDVWLATGVSVMAGVRIGKGSIVAAGSVVTHNLPAGVLAGGIPAKVIRHLDTTDKQGANHA